MSTDSGSYIAARKAIFRLLGLLYDLLYFLGCVAISVVAKVGAGSKKT